MAAISFTESDGLEAPESNGETDLAASSGSAERARRLRRLAVRVDSRSSLLNATRRPRRELPGDEQFGDPLSTAGAQPVEVLVSDALLARIDTASLRTGRSKRLRADGAPRDLHVVRISRD